ncbi:MAG: hypothetical protein AAGC60_02595 [Acidobacteriota bacterium]
MTTRPAALVSATLVPATVLAAAESYLRPHLVRLPPALAVRLYARGRRLALASLARRQPTPRLVPAGLERTLWGLTFRAPLLNAAGLWKSGAPDGYRLAVAQGAGGWLVGTTTHRPRPGNRRRGIAQPFAPYPRSRAASNWLGLPNPGHAAVAKALASLIAAGERVDGCPIGASLALDPAGDEVPETQRLAELVVGLERYADAGVDFLEINESCPNTEADVAGFEALERRLDHVAARFLSRRERPPVIVKLSCDTPLESVAPLVDLLVERGVDGINFGNTSTAYRVLRPDIDRRELRLFDHFTSTFGGGLSGHPLRPLSLELCRAAARRLAERPPAHEVHIVRTGGVESSGDIERSLDVGASLAQWYTGYFERFAAVGHDVYAGLWSDLETSLDRGP